MHVRDTTGTELSWLASIETGGSTSNNRMRQSLLSISLRSFFLAALAANGALSWGAPHPEAEAGALLASMQAELERAKDSLSKSDPAPYFISYEVYDQHIQRDEPPLGRRNDACGQPGARQYAQRESLFWNYLRSTSVGGRPRCHRAYVVGNDQS